MTGAPDDDGKLPRPTPAYPGSVDLLIVGSGPVGAAFARQVCTALPDVRILMVEAGPHLTDRPGMNVRQPATGSGPLSRLRRLKERGFRCRSPMGVPVGYPSGRVL